MAYMLQQIPARPTNGNSTTPVNGRIDATIRIDCFFSRNISGTMSVYMSVCVWMRVDSFCCVCGKVKGNQANTAKKQMWREFAF